MNFDSPSPAAEKMFPIAIFVLSASLFVVARPLLRPRRRQFRAIALDLDGTTLNSSHNLSTKTVSTLRRLNAKGVSVFIATGRSTNSVIPHIDALCLPQRTVPAVCFNGACVVDISTSIGVESMIYDSPIPRTSSDALLHFAADIGVVAQYYIGSTGQIYACPQNASHQALLDQYAEFTGKPQTIVESYETAKAIAPAAKILLMTEDADSLVEAAKKYFPDNMFHIIYGSPTPFFIEFLAPNTCKGNGLLQLCNHYHVPLEAVVAFGDGENDIEFLQYAGLGVAMNNAKYRTKQAADVVMEWSNDEDGVARFLDMLDREDAFTFQI
mmetsp:Transcript_4111/g.6366  ORF Transcript_4111/g.6366 Transcript_4111/m.6366 type:complete len:326 (-) Transcript_4111:37-1014(-)